MPRLRHGLALGILAIFATAGCTGDETAPEPTTTVTPTPDFPAAGSAADPGQTDTSAKKISVDAKIDPASIDIKQVSGRELEDLVAANKGKAVLFDFWATWCGPCVKQYPHTVELSKRHADDLVVYTVSFDDTDEDSLAAVKKFHADHGLGNVHPLISADGSAEESYEGFDITGGALPHYKLFDREGKLATTFGGDVEDPIEPEKIDAAVAKVIAR